MAATATTVDPLKLAAELWPHVTFYKQQREVIYSVWDNDETFVPAGNKLGKDFVAGAICLLFFLTRHPCRIVVTSAKEDHLRVIFGEINRYLQTSKYPLDHKRGGPLIVNHQDIRRVVAGQRCPISYLKGMVASQDTMAAMQGHHVAKTGDGISRTLFVADEASSVPHDYWRMARTWFNRALVIGNTWPCDNFFYRAVKGDPSINDPGGDLLAPDGQRYYRRVIRIKAADSPNVRLALAQQRLGQAPTGEMLVPGVKDWEEYLKDRATLDIVQQCVSLDAEFWEGAELLLFPPDWLNHAETLHDRLRGQKRQAEGVGIDPGEGSANTAFAAVDHQGLITLEAYPTPDTNTLPGLAVAFWQRHGVKPERVCIDAGGGGKQLADRLRAQGYPVRTVAFGESVQPNPRHGRHRLQDRLEQREERYAYVNRRAQMYGELSLLLDPSGIGFAIPREYTDLRRQLAVMPRLYDPEGRLRMLPKTKRNPDSKEKTLVELIGRSPDEADATVLACFAMLHQTRRAVAGAV